MLTSLAAAVLAVIMLAGCAVNAPGALPQDVTGAVTQVDRSEHGTLAPQPVVAPGKAKVAMLLPLSGPGNVAAAARAMKQAGEMALFERPSDGFELIVKDDRGTPEGARAAAEEAVREGVELILGPLLAGSVEAVTPVAAAARIPIVAFSNDRRVMKPNVYLLSFMPEQDVDRVVSYATSQGRRSFVALIPDDSYGRIVETAFARAVSAAQANITTIERYSRGSAGMLEATRRLAAVMANPTDDGAGAADALLLPGDPDTLLTIGPLLAYARIDTQRVKLLGTAGWDAPNVGRDQSLHGAWFAAPDPRGWQSFSERFAKAFGTVPPRIASDVAPRTPSLSTRPESCNTVVAWTATVPESAVALPLTV